MSGLTRKKVKVRGKNGKTFQRSVMVKSESGRMTSGQMLRKHYKTAIASGFGGGALGGVAGYAGAAIGHNIGHRVASKEYARNPIKGAAGAARLHATQNNVATIGNYAGMAAGLVGSAIARKKSQRYQSMAHDMQRNKGRAGAWALAGIHVGASVLGWGAGTVGSAHLHHAIGNRK